VYVLKNGENFKDWNSKLRAYLISPLPLATLTYFLKIVNQGRIHEFGKFPSEVSFVLILIRESSHI